MNVIDAMSRILRASSHEYVGLWEVRIKLFYEQVDGEEIIDKEEQLEAFAESEKVRTRELTYARDIVLTLFEQKWLMLLQCIEPDGEMTEITSDSEIRRIVHLNDNLVKEPKAGGKGFYLSITKKGEEILRDDILSLR
jgi:hypothetical protein